MIITCPNCKHSANTKRAITPGTRIKCRKCQHSWVYQSPSGWENLKLIKFVFKFLFLGVLTVIVLGACPRIRV